MVSYLYKSCEFKRFYQNKHNKQTKLSQNYFSTGSKDIVSTLKFS